MQKDKWIIKNSEIIPHIPYTCRLCGHRMTIKYTETDIIFYCQNSQCIAHQGISIYDWDE